MNFNSYIFILLFVPLVVIGYFFLNNKKHYRIAQGYLLVMSLVFYAYAGIPYFLLLLASVAGNYICSILIEKTGKKKLFMIIGIALNLGILFYYKYYDFFISNLNAIFQSDFVLKHIALPLGISFYTFQQLSFIVDRGTGRSKHYSLLDYMFFVTFFPQLVAGPIVKHDELIPQMYDKSKKTLSWDNLYEGIVLFVLGLSKKTLIADYISMAVDYGYNNVETLDTCSAVFAVLGFALQVYFDFSGYSDMAMGLGKMLNLDLPNNFNQPYRSRSFTEFWRRWHITLNRFLTEYVYFPLGGSRKGKFRKAMNTIFIFLLSGLWHGADWRYVIWCGVQGPIRVAEDHILKKKKENRSVIGWIYFFLVYNLLLVIFRSNSLPAAGQMYQRLFSFSWNGSISDIAFAMDNSLLFIPTQLIKAVGLGSLYGAIFPVYMILMYGLAIFLLTRKTPYQIVMERKEKKHRPGIIAFLLVACIVCFSKTEVFLYFNF